MSGRRGAASWGAPVGVIAALALAQFALPDYHHTNIARIMVLATFAVGYNIAFGYTGLLSLGHAMFFAAGLYGAGTTAHFLHFPMPAALAVGVMADLALALIVGLIALRTKGVSFLIVTLMFAQAVYLTTLYFNNITRGDEGFVLAEASRQLSLGGTVFAMSDPDVRYNCALLLFALCYLLSIICCIRRSAACSLQYARTSRAPRCSGTMPSATSCWR